MRRRLASESPHQGNVKLGEVSHHSLLVACRPADWQKIKDDDRGDPAGATGQAGEVSSRAGSECVENPAEMARQDWRRSRPMQCDLQEQDGAQQARARVQVQQHRQTR